MLGLAASPIPVAAAITGHSPAGGAVLAMYCDYRVMSRGELQDRAQRGRGRHPPAGGDPARLCPSRRSAPGRAPERHGRDDSAGRRRSGSASSTRWRHRIRSCRARSSGARGSSPCRRSPWRTPGGAPAPTSSGSSRRGSRPSWRPLVEHVVQRGDAEHPARHRRAHGGEEEGVTSASWESSLSLGRGPGRGRWDQWRGRSEWLYRPQRPGVAAR